MTAGEPLGSPAGFRRIEQCAQTGVLALELDANLHQNREALTPNAAKAILEYTSVPVPGADDLTQGAGQAVAENQPGA